jgi:ADP-heptose:LPS heptosyltransferase
MLSGFWVDKKFGLKTSPKGDAACFKMKSGFHFETCIIPPMSHPLINKVAVLFPEFLGDYINLIPFLHRLKTLLPAAEITLYIPPNMVDFASKHPALHRCLPMPERGTKAARKHLSQQLRAEKYDMAYFTNPDLLGIALAAKIRYRVHEHSDFLFRFTCKGTPMSALRNRFRQVPERHIHNLDHMFGAPLASRDYNYDTGIRPQKSPLLSDLSRYVVVNPDSHSCKRYDRDFFVNIITWLMSEGHTVVHVGLKDPHNLQSDLESHAQYRSLVGKTSIPQLIDIMAHADLFMGIDSGTAHLASVLGTPTLILYPPKGVTPAISCLLATKALPYQQSPFDSDCELACRHYQVCPLDTCARDYRLADVKVRIRQTMAATMSSEDRWQCIYQPSIPILVIPSRGHPMGSGAKGRSPLRPRLLAWLCRARRFVLGTNAPKPPHSTPTNLHKRVADFAASGMSIHVGSPDMATWSFSQMLAFIHRYNIRVIFWEGSRIPLKWWLLNRWLRFSERCFIGMHAGDLPSDAKVFFDRCFVALVGSPVSRPD